MGARRARGRFRPGPRLLDATAKLLDKNGVLELKIVDITREVGTSPATFYQYFVDVEAAILALVEQATLDELPLVILPHAMPGTTTTDWPRPASSSMRTWTTGRTTALYCACATSRPRRATQRFVRHDQRPIC